MEQPRTKRCNDIVQYTMKLLRTKSAEKTGNRLSETEIQFITTTMTQMIDDLGKSHPDDLPYLFKQFSTTARMMTALAGMTQLAIQSPERFSARQKAYRTGKMN